MSRTLNPAFVRRVPLVLAVCAAIAFLALGGRDYVSLDRLGHSAAHLRDIVRQHRVLAPFLFIAAYAALLLALVVPVSRCRLDG